MDGTRAPVGDLVSVIIPVMNEADNIAPLAAALTAALEPMGRPYEVIFIDDGSTDGTLKALSATTQANPRFKVIAFKRNVGQTGAMMAGIDNAKGAVIVPMDGDLQNDPADIPKLLAKLDEGYGVVSGWRRDRQDAFLTRTLPSRMANGLISWVSGVRLNDYGCTLKAYRREVLEGFRLYGEMHRFVPIYAKWQGAKIAELPVAHRARTAGTSKYGLDRVFKVLLDLLVVKFLTQYETKPIYIFGMVGLWFFAISFLAGVGALYEKYFDNTTFVQTPLPLLFTLGFITGVMCVLMGLLAEVLVRIYFEARDKAPYTVKERINFEPPNKMCGIAGFVGTGDADDLKRMADALIHRGPDDQGYFADQHLPVFLANRRLAVTDIPGGHQPMWDATGDLCVIFNGEIYNHRALRRRLEEKGARFQSDHADTEVLIHGYKLWGENLWCELNGMFAVAIYDRHRKRLVLARDRFGEKPLFYGVQGSTVAFASELTSLRTHRAFRAASLAPRALQKYFAHGFFPAEHTPYEGIYKLPAGHTLTIDTTSGAYRTQEYWRFGIRPDAAPPGNEHDWAEEVARLLGLSVQARLESDVPVGLFLSGGVDSSAVLSFAAETRVPSSIMTFSIGFRETSYDELSYAEEMALLVGTTHHVEICDLEAAQSEVPALLARMDEPIGDGSLLPTSLLARFAKAHVTVALTGDGGDELFAGYDPFRMLRVARAYNRFVPKPMHAAVKMMAGWLPTSDANMSLDFVLRRGLNGLKQPPALWNPLWLAPLQPDDIRALFESAVQPEDLYSEVIAAWDQSASPHTVDRVLEFYTRFYLADQLLVKADRASMAVSLETRAPFLDYDLADYVSRLPWQVKLRGGTTKWILKRALRDRLPGDILTRPKKGFGIPTGRWLREMAPPPAVAGFNDAPLRARWEAHAQGRGDHRLALWSWLALAHSLNGPAA